MLVFSTFLHANSALSVVLPFPPKKFDKETTLKIDMVRTQWSQNLSKIAKNLENVNWHYKAIFFLLSNIIWQCLCDFLTYQLLIGPTLKLACQKSMKTVFVEFTYQKLIPKDFASIVLWRMYL